MGRWVEQYRAEQHRQAWIDMTSLGPDLRSDEAALSAATTVAHETMRRRRHNVERLVERLPEIGFEFESEPVTDPPPDARRQLDTLESEIGILPLSLRTWFEEVGQINLNGVHPESRHGMGSRLVVRGAGGTGLPPQG